MPLLFAERHRHLEVFYFVRARCRSVSTVSAIKKGLNATREASAVQTQYRLETNPIAQIHRNGQRQATQRSSIDRQYGQGHSGKFSSRNRRDGQDQPATISRHVSNRGAPWRGLSVANTNPVPEHVNGNPLLKISAAAAKSSDTTYGDRRNVLGPPGWRMRIERSVGKQPSQHTPSPREPPRKIISTAQAQSSANIEEHMRKLVRSICRAVTAIQSAEISGDETLSTLLSTAREKLNRFNDTVTQAAQRTRSTALRGPTRRYTDFLSQELAHANAIVTPDELIADEPLTATKVLMVKYNSFRLALKGKKAPSFGSGGETQNEGNEGRTNRISLLYLSHIKAIAQELCTTAHLPRLLSDQKRDQIRDLLAQMQAFSVSQHTWSKLFESTVNRALRAPYGKGFRLTRTSDGRGNDVYVLASRRKGNPKLKLEFPFQDPNKATKITDQKSEVDSAEARSEKEHAENKDAEKPAADKNAKASFKLMAKICFDVRNALNRIHLAEAVSGPAHPPKASNVMHKNALKFVDALNGHLEAIENGSVKWNSDTESPHEVVRRKLGRPLVVDQQDETEKMSIGTTALVVKKDDGRYELVLKGQRASEANRPEPINSRKAASTESYNNSTGSDGIEEATASASVALSAPGMTPSATARPSLGASVEASLSADEADVDSKEGSLVAKSDSQDANAAKKGEKSSSEDSTEADDAVPISIPYTTAASQFLYGSNVVLAALRSRRRRLYHLYLHPRSSSREDNSDTIKSFAMSASVPITYQTNLKLMDEMSGGRPHNGVILEASRLPAPPVLNLKAPDAETNTIPLVCARQSAEETAINGSPSTLPSTAPSSRRHPFVLFLDGITDPGNVGNIIRTAHFYHVDAVAIAINTCADLASPVVAKASAGACEAVRLLALPRPADFIFTSAKNGWKIYAAMAPQMTPGIGDSGTERLTTAEVVHTAPAAQSPCILMLGAEGDGLRANLVAKADAFVSIARAGAGGDVVDVGLDSLNVGVAAGVLLEAFLRSA